MPNLPSAPSIPSLPSVPSIPGNLNITMPDYVPTKEELEELFPDKDKQEMLDTNVPKPKPVIKCPTCETQKAYQKKQKELAKAKEKLDKQVEKLIKGPQQALENAKKQLENFIDAFSGYEDIDDPNVNPAPVLRMINSLLLPVAEPLKSLPLDVVPGLNQLVNLIPTLIEMSMPAANQAEINKKVPVRPELSDAESGLADNFASAIQTMSTMFMFVLITIIIEMINAVVKLIKQLFDAVGLSLDSLPSPLDVLLDLASLLPKIYKLVTNLPCNMQRSVKGIMRSKLQELEAMSQIDPFEDIKDINISCDQHPEIPDVPEFDYSDVEGDESFNDSPDD